MTECGGIIKGEAPPNRGDIREGVQGQRGSHYNPHNMQSLQKYTEAQKSMGVYGGCVHPWGHTNIWGIQMYGVYKHGGVQTPPSIKTCLPLKSRKNPI